MESIRSSFTTSVAPAAKVNGMPLPDRTPLTQIVRQGCELEITPALAQRILAEAHCEYHTPPTPSSVDFLAGEIKAGRFQRSRQATHLWFAQLNEKLVLLVGGPRLAAVVRSGLAVRFLIGVTLIDNEDQLRALAAGGTAKRNVLRATAREDRSNPVNMTAAKVLPPARLTQILMHGHEVRISPALAERIEKECRYAHERPLKQWRVEALAAEMERNGFEQGRQISFALLNGKLIRTNGQHRLQAVVNTGKAQTFMVEVRPVANEDELAEVYATYDNESRTLSETAGPLLTRGGLSKERVATLLRSVRFLYTGFHGADAKQAATMRSHVSRNQVADEWYPYAERFFAATEDARPQVKAALRRQSVAAFGIYTFRVQPEKADEFWRGLAMDDGLRRNDPRKALSEKLRSGDSARSIPIQMHAVAAAWKAFLAGRKMKEVRVRLNQPFVIAGTTVVVDRLDEELAHA